MAPGFGNRFGSSELLVPLKGKAPYCRGLDCIRRVVGELKEEGYQTEVPAVSQHEEILGQAKGQGLRTVLNRFSGQGITASPRLRTGSASPESGALPFSMANQPYMNLFTLREFAHGFQLAGEGMGCVCYQGERGNPATFASAYREELIGLRGDRGGSVIVKMYSEGVWIVEVLEEELKDINRAEDSGAVQS